MLWVLLHQIPSSLLARYVQAVHTQWQRSETRTKLSLRAVRQCAKNASRMVNAAHLEIFDAICRMVIIKLEICTCAAVQIKCQQSMVVYIHWLSDCCSCQSIRSKAISFQRTVLKSGFIQTFQKHKKINRIAYENAEENEGEKQNQQRAQAKQSRK